MENKQPKILCANATRFIRTVDTHERHHYEERPMTLTAWTQTTSDDFGILMNTPFDLPEPAVHGQNINKVLLDKIRFLQESLRQHTEMLTQIHSTEKMNFDVAQQCSTPLTLAHKTQYTNEIQSAPVAVEYPLPPQILTPPNSIININTVQQIPIHTTESINYKIVTDDKNGSADEPLEIKLTYESGLNMSADSDRLEICLDDELNKQTSRDCVVDTPPSPQFIKRRKLDHSEDTGVNKTSTYATQNNVSLPSNNGIEQDIKDIIKQEQHRKPRKQNVLKAPKSNYININNNIQTYNPPNAFETTGAKKQTENIMVSIGPNNTCVPAKLFESINWTSCSIATRKLMMAIFDRTTLATHSMTGKPSPAFKDQQRPLKQMLDPLKIQDIIFAVTHKCTTTEKEVRNAITTKCADENKMLKLKLKRLSMNEDLANGITNKENIVHC